MQSQSVNGQVIVLEGADFSGKSTLANQLMAKYRNHVYIHCAVTDDIKKLHETAFLNAMELANHGQFTVIIDRLHYSELVYGTIFRNGPCYDVKKFDEWISDPNLHPNVRKILCLPPKVVVLNGFKKRSADGGEMFDTVEKVYDMYAQNPLGWNIYDWTKGEELDLERFKP